MADKEMGYTTVELAQKRNIPARILRYWVKNGLPHSVRGGVTFIKLEDLDRFIKERVEVKTTYHLKSQEEELGPEDE